MVAGDLIMFNKNRDINAMTEEMRLLRKETDLERSHERADELLIEALRFMQNTHHDIVDGDVEDLIAAWKKLGKWYA